MTNATAPECSPVCGLHCALQPSMLAPPAVVGRLMQLVHANDDMTIHHSHKSVQLLACGLILGR